MDHGAFVIQNTHTAVWAEFKKGFLLNMFINYSVSGPSRSEQIYKSSPI